MATQNDRIPAKMYFSHIGGKLGTLVMEAFIDKGWIAKKNPEDKNFYVTEIGKKEFARLGLDLTQIKPEDI